MIIDPSTGLPYHFMHVATGGNSDGSYEDPYATLAAAFADPRTQMGDVVVYDHRNDSETGDFTLATNTKVLSTGPAQFIDSQFGLIQLPDSNSGLTPEVAGSFTLNNRSVLSGFDIITEGSNPSISASGVGDLTVSNNTIDHMGVGAAIKLTNLTGPATFNQTPLTKSGGLGVSISGGSGDVTFTNSSITNTNGNGIDIQNAGGTILFGQITTTNGTSPVNVSNSTANITINNLNSTDSGTDTVRIDNLTGGSFALNGGTITDSGGSGVYASNSENITIKSTTIDTPSGEGILAQNVTNFNFSSNTIDDAGIDGIAVTNGSGNGTISGNTIRSILTAFDDAIDVNINGDATVDIDNNIISSVLALAGTGIEVSTSGASNVTTRIRGNQITSILNAFGDGINYTSNSTGAMTTTITGNTIQNTAGVFGDGISVVYNSGSATTNISQNTIDSDDLVNLFGTGIYLGLNTTGTTDTTIDQNTISDDVLAALFDDGISLDIDRGTDHDIFVTNNLIAQTGGLFDDSIEVLLDSGTASAARIQVNNNILFGAGGGGVGLDVFVGSPHLLCVEATGNTTNTSLDFFAAVGGTINVEDLPNLSANNNGATVNTGGGGTIINIADCFP
ncbi:MAG: right-handed parallel beta-helix repeat-containing protein [Planctomycetes bacterium]|nr:right-handed parallel beta-helix repeat-containing protein [Planctomycetota bacterium]MCH9725979.1 right-handed parallel beta-helix repeat-containing protein [Planctomycetota bacterium]MCH9777132.1 right-handed parallel beta-helix repeat-containing protein [Planctomycetota bacterium]MCH9790888.1 right-handed parallel beta-helix repeat-containing protein [Planctomycetota bacterium]